MRVNMPFANVYPWEDAKVPLIKSSNFIYFVKALYLKILLPFFSLTAGANKTTIKNTCMHMHMCKHIYNKNKKEGRLWRSKRYKRSCIASASDEDSRNIFMTSLFFCLLFFILLYTSLISILYLRNKQISQKYNQNKEPFTLCLTKLDAFVHNKGCLVKNLKEVFYGQLSIIAYITKSS